MLSVVRLQIMLVAKKYLKFTKFFQVCKAYKFYMSNRYKGLNSEEKQEKGFAYALNQR